MLIAFEGIDGSGKSTQAEMLDSYFKSSGIAAVMTAEPTSGPIGKLIKEIVVSKKPINALAMQMLFTADRAYHLETTIMPSISEGKVIITDRYIGSTIAYGTAAGIDKRFLVGINRKFVPPDITFVIDANPRKAVERLNRRAAEFLKNKTALMEKDGELFKQKSTTTMFEKLGFLGRARLAYLEMQKDFKNYYIINGNRSKGSISKEIINILDTKI